MPDSYTLNVPHVLYDNSEEDVPPLQRARVVPRIYADHHGISISFTPEGQDTPAHDVYIEFYEGQIIVHVYDDLETYEEPAHVVDITPRKDVVIPPCVHLPEERLQR